MKALCLWGREEDQTPIVFALPGDGEMYRANYGEAKRFARKREFEKPRWIKSYLRGWDDGVKSLNPVLRFAFWLDERILPDPEILAFRDVVDIS